MSDLLCFLAEYRKDCSKMILEDVDMMTHECYHDISQVYDLLSYYTDKRNSFERFSVDFQYNWSKMTYVQDIIDCFKRFITTNQGVTQE